MDFATATLIAKLTGQELPRDEPRVRVRVTTVSADIVAAGVRIAPSPDAKRTVVAPGLTSAVAEVEVYESDVAKLEAMVEDQLSEAAIATVHDLFEADFAAWAETRLAGLQDRQRDEAEARARQEFPASFVGYFRRAFPKLKRDLRPFLKVERVVVEKTKKAA